MLLILILLQGRTCTVLAVARMKAVLGFLSAHVGKRIPKLSSRDFSVIATVARFSASAFKHYLSAYLFPPSSFLSLFFFSFTRKNQLAGIKCL